MNLKMIQLLHKTKKKVTHSLLSFWYWLMTPIAYFFTTEKVNARYKKKQDKISREDATRYIAEDIAKYLVTKNRDKDMTFIIADYFDDDYFSGYYSLKYINSRLLKRRKTEMGYFKLKVRDIKTQIEIIEQLKKISGIEVREEIEMFKWEHPRNYQSTYHVSYKG